VSRYQPSQISASEQQLSSAFVEAALVSHSMRILVSYYENIKTSPTISPTLAGGLNRSAVLMLAA
jgi:hypothetical protein